MVLPGEENKPVTGPVTISYFSTPYLPEDPNASQQQIWVRVTPRSQFCAAHINALLKPYDKEMSAKCTYHVGREARPGQDLVHIYNFEGKLRIDPTKVTDFYNTATK